MAVRQAELVADRDAVIYRFPTEQVRARIVRRRRAEARRRRLGMTLVAVGVVIATLLATGPRGIAPASKPGAPATVTVAPGDTVWDLATLYAPEGVDPRAYVDALLELNGLNTMPEAGATLRLP